MRAGEEGIDNRILGYPQPLRKTARGLKARQPAVFIISGTIITTDVSVRHFRETGQKGVAIRRIVRVQIGEERIEGGMPLAGQTNVRQ